MNRDRDLKEKFVELSCFETVVLLRGTRPFTESDKMLDVGFL